MIPSFDLFHEVIRRYGADAPEAANLIAVLADHPEIATAVAAETAEAEELAAALGEAHKPVGVA